MMAKRPEDRYQTGLEVIRDVVRLRDLLVGVSGTPKDALISLGPAPSEPFDAIATQVIPSFRRRRWLPWMLGLGIVLAVTGGVGYGWLSAHRTGEARPGQDLPAESKIQRSRKEQEDFLVKVVKERYALPQTQAEMLEGLPFYIELGLLYLKDRRLDKAEAFFKGINQPGQKRVYLVFGKLGEAMVLAFRDRPKESNKLFANSLNPKGAATLTLGPRGLLNHPQIRAMIAEALHYNEANDKEAFPQVLRPYLKPPAPTPKTPPKKSAGK
jgi:hypothetical protein